MITTRYHVASPKLYIIQNNVFNSNKCFLQPYHFEVIFKIDNVYRKVFWILLGKTDSMEMHYCTKNKQNWTVYIFVLCKTLMQ